MFQRKLIVVLILLLFIVSWVVGFYFGRKVETDKQLNYHFSQSHAETLIAAIEMIKNSQIEETSLHLEKSLDSSLFPVFYEISNGNLSKAEINRVGKLIKRIDKILQRKDADYLPQMLSANEQAKKEYYSYIQKGLAEIRKLNANSLNQQRVK